MTERAPDIKKLEDMLNDCESDDALNEQAIKIFERMVDDAFDVQLQSKDTAEGKRKLVADCDELEKVIEQIETRKHARVLDRFKKFLMDYKP